jgi:hypothetical protein
MSHQRLIGLERLIGFVNPRKQRWLVILAVLAAIMALGLVLGSVLRAYGRSHYDYLTSVPAMSAPTLSRAALS